MALNLLLGAPTDLLCFSTAGFVAVFVTVVFDALHVLLLYQLRCCHELQALHSCGNACRREVTGGTSSWIMVEQCMAWLCYHVSICRNILLLFQMPVWPSAARAVAMGHR